MDYLYRARIMDSPIRARIRDHRPLKQGMDIRPPRRGLDRGLRPWTAQIGSGSWIVQWRMRPWTAQTRLGSQTTQIGPRPEADTIDYSERDGVLDCPVRARTTDHPD